MKQRSAQFSKEHIQSMRAQCLQLSCNELDMVLLGQLIASTNTSDKVVQESRHLEKERERTYSTYNHADKPVCAKTFLFLHTVGKKRLRNLSLSLRENGLTPRVHGNSRRLPKHSLSYQAIEYVVRFLLTYSKQHALLPGRIPGYHRSDMKLPPSSVSKRGIWRVYQSAAESSESIHQVAYHDLLSAMETTSSIHPHNEADVRIPEISRSIIRLIMLSKFIFQAIHSNRDQFPYSPQVQCLQSEL